MTDRTPSTAARGVAMGAVILVCAVAGCSASTSTSTRPVPGATRAVAPATPTKPAALTGDALCGLLGPGDLGSLVYGDTTGGPAAESSGGLAGCRWPVSGSRKDLAIFVDKESGGSEREDFGEFAQVAKTVAGQTLVRTTTGASACDAVVYGPQVPSTYFLRVKYEADKGRLKGQDPCEPTLSAVGVVLAKLGWATR